MNGADLVVVILVVMLVLVVVVMLLGGDIGDIRLSKKSSGARRLVFAATAKSPGASSRIS